MSAVVSRRARSRRRLVQRVDELVTLSSDRDVLHLGCTNWPYTAESDRAGTLLHRSLHGSARSLTGLDADRAGLAALQRLGFDRLVVGDLEHLADASWFDRGAESEEGEAEEGESDDAGPDTTGLDEARLGTYDLVIAGEVLEHLGSPAALLAGVRPLLAAEGELVITVPNAYCAFRMASYAASGVRGNPEPVHPDHVAYYSEATLSHLLDREGYALVDLCFYDLGREHRPTAPRSWRVVNDVAMRVAPQLADGVVARCRPLPP